MVFWIWRSSRSLVLQTAPLYAGILRPKIHRLELRRVCDTEHIADIVGAVDMVEARQSGASIPDLFSRIQALADPRSEPLRF